MGKGSPVARLNKLLRNHLSRFKGHLTIEEATGTLGALAVLVVMIFTASDTILRYFMKSPLSFAMNLGELLLVTVVFLVLASLNQVGGHIRVQVLVRYFPQKVRYTLDFASSLIGVLVYGYIGWRAWLWALEAWQGSYVYMGRAELRVPESIPYGIIVFGSFALCWSLFFGALSSLRNITSPNRRMRQPRSTS